MDDEYSRIAVVFDVQYNGHGDGYCSGEECNVTMSQEIRLYTLNDFEYGRYDRYEEIDDLCEVVFCEELDVDVPYITEIRNQSGSFYCANNGDRLGFKRHECRLTATRVCLVDVDSDDNSD